jgi:ribosomal protein S18 acetylase RimI-like enzyme
MNPILYFLRSSEHKIVTDMLFYAARLDDLGKSLQDVPPLYMYERHYGLNHTDMGLYALVGHELAGAAWIRLFREGEGIDAYVDDATPVLMVGVKPQFRAKGVGTAMLEQLFAEAGALYERLSISVVENSPALKLFERLGFVQIEGSQKSSVLDGAVSVTMLKELPKQALERPSEGYDPRRWMD